MVEKNNDNIVRIGKKTVRTYAEAAMISFEEQGNKEVVLKARGMGIYTACSTAEFLKRKKDVKVSKIDLSSEELQDKKYPDKKVFVPTLEITLVR